MKSHVSELHESGAKGQRDRLRVVQKYDELCRICKIKKTPDAEIAKLTNNQLYHLCEDTFNALPARRKDYYGKMLGLGLENDLSFKWWWRRSVQYFRPGIAGKIELGIKSAWLYPQYVKRKKAHIKDEYIKNHTLHDAKIVPLREQKAASAALATDFSIEKIGKKADA